MELTLTGASLNSDAGGASLPRHRNGRAGNNESTSTSTSSRASSDSNNNNITRNTQQKQQNHFHSHSENKHGNAHNHDEECAGHHGHTAQSHSHSYSHDHGHSHSHSHSHNKQCYNKPQLHSQANANNFVDVTAVPKEKLTQHPDVLMNALITSVRGKGFETFTYLIHVVLDFEKTLQLQLSASDTNGKNSQLARMKWGTPPKNESKNDIQSNSESNDGSDNYDCKSCLNHYSSEGHTIAHWCAKHSDVRFLEYLVNHVPNLDINLPSLDDIGMRPIHWACTEGSIPNAAFILKHCSYGNAKNIQNHNIHDIINTVDSSNCTPLLIAAQYGHADLVAFLVKRGADSYATDNAGDTAFHWAAYKGSVPVCSLLLHLHCYHDTQNRHGFSNDMRRKVNSHGDLYGYLDLQDSFGQSPLHLASLRGNVDVVNYILEEAERFVDRSKMIVGKHRNKNTDRTAIPLLQNTGIDSGVDVDIVIDDDIESNYSYRDINIARYPSMLLNLKDKNGKSPIDLAIKKKQSTTELLLRKFMDKHSTYNQSLFGHMKMCVSQFLSIRNWLLWMGFVSEGGGRPPKFIFWFVVINLMIATCIEAFVYAPRLGANFMGLYYFTCSGFFMTWVTLILVNQTDPGILKITTSSSAVSPTTSEYSNWVLLKCRRVCSFIRPTSSNFFLSCNSGENKRIKREMHLVSSELHREYEETLESFANIEKTSVNKKQLLCHSCHIVRPARSKHCRVLNRCILLFDHHCPFVGTTVGLYNYKYFYAFVIFFTFTDILFTITGFLHWKHRHEASMEVWTLLMVIYFSLYTLMTGGLSIYHTQLIHLNLTTNEHQNMFRYDYLNSTNDDGSVGIRNPFDRKGFVRNFWDRVFPSRESYTITSDNGRTGNTDGAGNANDDCSGLEIHSISNKKTDEDGQNLENVVSIV